MKIANSPRHTLLQSRASQKASSFHNPPTTQQVEKSPKEVVKKRRYFCCCGNDDEMNEENYVHEVNDVVFTTSSGSTTMTSEVIEEEENSNKNIIDKPVKRPVNQPIRSVISSSLPVPMKSSSNEERLSKSQPITNMNSSKQDDIRQSALSMDRGMGSFIQDLKRSQGSCVSSRSWNLSD